jgi:Spy/CpxP family protein refolding chaperone
MKRLLVVSLVLVFVLSSAAFAQPGQGHKNCCDKSQHGMKAEGHHKGFGIKRLLRVADEINLSEDQKDKLKSMAKEFQLQKVDLEADIKKARILLRDLMHDDNASEQDVFRAIDKATALKANMKKMKYRHMKSAKNILSDEQKDKLKSLRKEHMEKRGMGKMGFKQGAHIQRFPNRK